MHQLRWLRGEKHQARASSRCRSSSDRRLTGKRRGAAILSSSGLTLRRGRPCPTSRFATTSTCCGCSGASAGCLRRADWTDADYFECRASAGGPRSPIDTGCCSLCDPVSPTLRRSFARSEVLVLDPTDLVDEHGIPGAGPSPLSSRNQPGTGPIYRRPRARIAERPVISATESAV
jgi:hypothetical protein